LAGEIYTTFTFLGGSGWAYGKGGPAVYIFAYASLGYLISYWLLPAIWKYAKEHNLISQSDFFVSKYKSPYLGVLVALVGVIAMIPYLVLQLTGLGIIVSTASYGLITSEAAIWIGMISVTVYVMISGIHGSVWTAVIKDTMILIVALFLGVYIPFHYYGGIQPMFEAIDAAKPGFLILPNKGLSGSWFISTVILTSLGFYMWPHTFGSAFSAKSAKTFRKNAIMIPLYSLIQLLVFFVGFAAILQVPGLKGSQVDLALLKISVKTFDPWFVGVIGAAGLLTALVPGSMILMTAATMLAKNVYKVFSFSASDRQVGVLAKWLVPVVGLVSVYFTLKGGETIVMFLLMGYSLVTQLAPALFFSLAKKPWVTKQGAFAGIITGGAIVAYTTVTNMTNGTLFPDLPQAIQDLNVGIVALVFNTLVMLGVSFITKAFSLAPAQKSENRQASQ
jgi:SSS family solute:Na+ symporter